MTPPPSVLPDVGNDAPDYWQEACRHLMKRDRVLKKLIPQHPGVSLQSRGDAFVTLARSIVGQQISVKAAQSVWERFIAVAGAPAYALLEAHEAAPAVMAALRAGWPEFGDANRFMVPDRQLLDASDLRIEP